MPPTAPGTRVSPITNAGVPSMPSAQARRCVSSRYASIAGSATPDAIVAETIRLASVTLDARRLGWLEKRSDRIFRS